MQVTARGRKMGEPAVAVARRLIATYGFVTAGLLLIESQLSTAAQAYRVLRKLGVACETHGGVLFCGDMNAVRDYIELVIATALAAKESWNCRTRCCSRSIATVARDDTLNALLNAAGIARGVAFISRLLRERADKRVRIIKRSGRRWLVTICA